MLYDVIRLERVLKNHSSKCDTHLAESLFQISSGVILKQRQYREAYIMKLSSLLEKLEYTCVQGSTEQEVTGVVYDSSKVQDGLSVYLYQRCCV